MQQRFDCNCALMPRSCFFEEFQATRIGHLVMQSGWVGVKYVAFYSCCCVFR